MKLTIIALALVLSISLGYEFAKPKNGTELEETIRSELDDIWVVQWYQKKSSDGGDDAAAAPAEGDEAAAPAEEAAGEEVNPEDFNEDIDDVQLKIQKACPTLTKEYKFVQADLQEDKQRDEENNDRDTDFKELMTKLKIDDEKFTALKKNGSVISVLYRLNGVKVAGPDFDVKVCDFIEAKKEERKQHEKDEARKRKEADKKNKSDDDSKVSKGPKKGELHPGGQK